MRDRSKLYCFSPLVMIVTFAAEILFAAYTLWRYKLNEISRLVVVILALLAAFQLAEYMVCEGSLMHGLTWSRIGFVAIAMLPPLGVHLIYAIAHAKRRPFLGPAYAAAAGFTTFFIGMSTAFSGHECVGNYAIFQVSEGLGALFAFYYYFWLAAGAILAWHFGLRTKKASTRKALKAMVFGYAAFIMPTAAVIVISPDTIRGIPSVMCGFAGLLAIILVALVLPNSATARKRT